jgi:hypothetical protein
MFNAYSIIGQISLIAWLAVMYPIFMQAAKEEDENDEASLSPLEEIIKLKGLVFFYGCCCPWR